MGLVVEAQLMELVWSSASKQGPKLPTHVVMLDPSFTWPATLSKLYCPPSFQILSYHNVADFLVLS